MLQRNRGHEAHSKDRMRRPAAGTVMGAGEEEIWRRLGEESVDV